MPTPRFSVIIPAYDRQAYLDEAVASVLGQSFADFELFVMDDHSPTPLTVLPDARVTLIRSEANAGKAAGINRALERAQGEFIAFLDDDDAWGPHRLAHAHAAHQLAPIAVCRMVSMHGGACSDSPQAPMRRKTRRELARSEMPSSMNNVSVSRAMCPTFDPEFRACEDIDWGIRLQQRTTEVVAIDSVDSLWRRHDGPRHRNAREARILASEELLRRHASHYDAHPSQKAARLYRIGYMYMQGGDLSKSSRYALRSLQASPTRSAVVLLAKILRRTLTPLKHRNRL